MPPISSAGWLGWTRMPRTPRSPMVLRQRVTLRILTRGEDEIFVAHQLGYGGGNFGDDCSFEWAGVGPRVVAVVEEKFAKFTDGHARDRMEGFSVESLEDEPV